MIRTPLTLVCLFASPAVADTTITVDGGRGPVVVHVPDAYDPSVSLPLVMLLHGYCGTGPGQEAYMQFAQHVDTGNFFYLYPTGLFDSSCNYWNGTPACCAFFAMPDDSSYLAALIDAVKAELSVDPLKVHLVGHSNGGFMSYRMACDHAGTIASIASLAGATFRNLSSCHATEPVHVLQIHGTQDTVIDFDGGFINGVPYPGAQETVDLWITIDGCSTTATTGAPLNLVVNLFGDETQVTIFDTGCEPGGSAELWTIQNGSHSPNLAAGFSAHVLDWFDAHPKPAVGTSYCVSSANSTGKPSRLYAYGSPSVSQNQPLTFVATNVPSGAAGGLLFSSGAIQIPLFDGTLCVGPSFQLQLPFLISSAGGEVRRTLVVPQTPALAGFAGRFQFGFLDPGGGPAGVNFSDGLAVTLAP